MHTHTETTKTYRYRSTDNQGRRGQSAAKTPPRASEWRPQPVGLTRDELRRIVIDQLG